MQSFSKHEPCLWKEGVGPRPHHCQSLSILRQTRAIPRRIFHFGCDFQGIPIELSVHLFCDPSRNSRREPVRESTFRRLLPAANSPHYSAQVSVVATAGLCPHICFEASHLASYHFIIPLLQIHFLVWKAQLMDTLYWVDSWDRALMSHLILQIDILSHFMPHSTNLCKSLTRHLWNPSHKFELVVPADTWREWNRKREVFELHSLSV